MSFTEVVFLTLAPPILAFCLYLLDMKYGKSKYLWLRNCGRSPEDQLPASANVGFVHNQKKSAWLFFLAAVWSFIPAQFYWYCGTSRFVELIVFADFLAMTWAVFMFSEEIYSWWDKFLGFFRSVDQLKEKIDSGEVKIPSFGDKVRRCFVWVSGFWPFGQAVKPAPVAPVVLAPVVEMPKVEEPKVDHRKALNEILRRRGM